MFIRTLNKMRRFITGTTTTYIRHYDDDADNDDDTNEYCNTATATRVHCSGDTDTHTDI